MAGKRPETSSHLAACDGSGRGLSVGRDVGDSDPGGAERAREERRARERQGGDLINSPAIV
eukprot:755602-Hanusia_phi.AAC.6